MNIGIIGLGLIGGSLGRTIVSKTEHVVYASDIDAKAMLLGELLNAYHHKLDDDCLSKLDILIVALYPNATIKVLNDILPKLKKGCIVMDICGNKRKIVANYKKFASTYSNLTFISSHPMAGREFSGIKHSSINLFERASMILVPVNADLFTTKSVKDFCLSLGFGSVIISSAEEHDKIIAFTSQLAHIVSSAYIKSPTAENYLGFSAGSFRDMTRVARLSPEMWTELMIDNGDNLAVEIKHMISSLNDYLKAIEDKNSDKLFGLLKDGTERKLRAEKLKNKKID